VYHFLRDRKDWIVTFLLFFFTGLAIVLYLNQAGNQPRERDYAFVGSFYAFAIWIGLSVVGFVRLARETTERDSFKQVLLYGSIASFIITLLSNTTTTPGAALFSSLIAAAVYAAVIAIIHFAVKAASGRTQNLRMATIVALAFGLIVPGLMAAEVWNDHDRSEKTLAPSMAKNYLESCAPNAVLFTFGDNDTYPLWYAQEVEGVRPDIRIINTSLLGIDWYVNMLRYKINESAPIDVIWTPEQISGLSYIMHRPQGEQDKPYPLYDIMKDVIGPMLNSEDKANIQATFPVKKFLVPVDAAALAQYGVTNPTDTVLSQLQIDLPEGKNYLTLDQLTILNIIAANNWKRPIYFTSPYGELGFGQYLRKDGLTYRLVPVKNNFPQQNWVVDQALRGTSIRDNNLDVMKANLMKFTTGGASNPGVYFDEENRRHLLSVRSTFAELSGNLSDKGRKAEAVQLLDKAEGMISTVNMPHAMVSRYNSHNQTALIYLEAAYKAGHTTLVNKLKTAIRTDLTQQKAYYDYLRNEKEDFFNSVSRESEINEFMIQLLEALEKQYGTPPPQVVEQPKVAADSLQ
jgi:hypothetical protein